MNRKGIARCLDKEVIDMKKTATGLALLVACVCFAQDAQLTTSRGFTLIESVPQGSGVYSWTNHTAYPFKVTGMAFDMPTAHTAVVQRIKTISSNQVVGNVVSTNDMGGVETNYYYTVTNVAKSYLTNTILTATSGGTAVYDYDDIKQVYIDKGDILKWTLTYTNAVKIIFDGQR